MDLDNLRLAPSVHSLANHCSSSLVNRGYDLLTYRRSGSFCSRLRLTRRSGSLTTRGSGSLATRGSGSLAHRRYDSIAARNSGSLALHRSSSLTTHGYDSRTHHHSNSLAACGSCSLGHHRSGLLPLCEHNTCRAFSLVFLFLFYILICSPDQVNLTTNSVDQL